MFLACIMQMAQLGPTAPSVGDHTVQTPSRGSATTQISAPCFLVYKYPKETTLFCFSCQQIMGSAQRTGSVLCWEHRYWKCDSQVTYLLDRRPSSTTQLFGENQASHQLQLFWALISLLLGLSPYYYAYPRVYCYWWFNPQLCSMQCLVSMVWSMLRSSPLPSSVRSVAIPCSLALSLSKWKTSTLWLDVCCQIHVL